MSTPHELIPNAYYSADALGKALGLLPGAINRARLAGSLKSTTRGGIPLYLGAWVHEWLMVDTPPRTRAPNKRQTVGA